MSETGAILSYNEVAEGKIIDSRPDRSATLNQNIELVN